MSTAGTQPLTASIILCTRRRPGMLADALAAHIGDRSRVDRELIVVDNASGDETPQVVRAAAAAAPFSIRYLHEPRVGVSNARNRGVGEARGDLILFTDDDVIVEDGWADEMARPFGDPAVGAVGGRVLPRWPHSPPGWLRGSHADLITMVDRGEEPRRYTPEETPSGASMAVRVSALEGVRAPFDVELGRRGDDSMAGEEDAVLFGLHDRGWAVLYTPSARAWHRITPERMTWGAMKRQHFSSGVAHARVERKRRGRVQGGLARRGVWFARAVVRAVRGIDGTVPLTAEEAMSRLDAWLWLGYHAEALFGGVPALARFVERLLGPSRRPG